MNPLKAVLSLITHDNDYQLEPPGHDSPPGGLDVQQIQGSACCCGRRSSRRRYSLPKNHRQFASQTTRWGCFITEGAAVQRTS